MVPFQSSNLPIFQPYILTLKNKLLYKTYFGGNKWQFSTSPNKEQRSINLETK